MNSKTLSVNLASGEYKIKFIIEDDGKRSVEIPALKMNDDTDAENVSEIMAFAYSFLCGDMNLDEYPFD